MTNTAMMREWIERHGLKLQAIAETIGCTPASLRNKINNSTEFKASEINAIVSEYGMSSEDRDAIFFCTCVE